jgi:hypothetical protein
VLENSIIEKSLVHVDHVMHSALQGTFMGVRPGKCPAFRGEVAHQNAPKRLLEFRSSGTSIKSIRFALRPSSTYYKFREGPVLS